MLYIHGFLLFFFILIGIAGLIFQVGEGVFIGLALGPWEARLVMNALGKTNLKWVKYYIIVGGIAGTIYFLLQSSWGWAAAMAFVNAYIYLVVVKSEIKAKKRLEEEEDNIEVSG